MKTILQIHTPGIPGVPTPSRPYPPPMVPSGCFEKEIKGVILYPPKGTLVRFEDKSLNGWGTIVEHHTWYVDKGEMQIMLKPLPLLPLAECERVKAAFLKLGWVDRSPPTQPELVA